MWFLSIGDPQRCGWSPTSSTRPGTWYFAGTCRRKEVGNKEKARWKEKQFTLPFATFSRSQPCSPAAVPYFQPLPQADRGPEGPGSVSIRLQHMPGVPASFLAQTAVSLRSHQTPVLGSCMVLGKRPVFSTFLHFR